MRDLRGERETLMLHLEKVNVYYGESHILRNVSFHIEAGQVACVMGRNGVGKSTTLKAIMGLLPVRSGRVLFDGSDITNAATDRRAKRGLAYVPQGREIIPHLSVRENLKLGYWARGNSSNGMTEKAAFDEVYTLFPKLTQILERPGGVLSGESSNNWPSVAPSCRVRKCCCWTNPPKAFSPPSLIRSKTSSSALRWLAGLRLCWLSRASILRRDWRTVMW